MIRRGARALQASLVVVALMALAALLARPAAAAFVIPPLADGHLVDTAGKLGPQDIDALNRQMEAFRLRTGNVIDVLVTGSLGGESIDDVAYRTFNTWKPGEGNKDNGVLVVIAPNERRDRIEVGKGLEGALTDLQTDDIRQRFIEPRLKVDDVRGALSGGIDAIARALTAGWVEDHRLGDRATMFP